MNRDFQHNVIVEVGDGRVAGAILENGFLQMCTQRSIGVHLLTPGARFQPFVERYGREGVAFTYLPSERAIQVDPALARLNFMAERLARLGFRRARTLVWRLIGEKLAARRSGELGALVEAERPDLVVSCNVSLGFDLGTIARARRLGIPTLGNVFSWDHPFRIQKTRADKVTCWSNQIKAWLLEFTGYTERQIEVIGAPAFDAYLGPECQWSRKQLAHHLGLDPSRPILVFATLGQHRQMIDETAPFRALISALDEGRIAGRPQVILRLHPLSVDLYFGEYRNHPDVRFSRFARYCPGMRWWPAKDEVVLAGNILRHADVVLSAGSTMAIEPSMFDTPTVVPVFNPFTTEDFEKFFEFHWMSKHFRFLKDRDLLPFAYSSEEMLTMLKRCLEDPAWKAEGRRAIREELLGPLDGNATQRLVGAVEELLEGRRQ